MIQKFLYRGITNSYVYLWSITDADVRIWLRTYFQVLLREEETKMALDDADIKAVELDAQKALLEQVAV